MKLLEYNLEEQALDTLLNRMLETACLKSIRVYTINYRNHALAPKHVCEKADGRTYPVPGRMFELVKNAGRALILNEPSFVHARQTYEKQDPENAAEVYIPLKKTLDTKDYCYGLLVLALDTEVNESEFLKDPELCELLKKANSRLSAEDDAARRRESMMQIAYMLCEIIDGKEPYLISRLFNMAYWGIRIARRMGLDDEEIEKLQVAVLMHDLGKIYIDESILNKRGELSEVEYGIIKKRVIYSHDIAAKLNELFVIDDLPEIILCYQERMDGKGYPNGLKRDQIPLLSKILGMAKAVSSMLSNMSYRRAKSIPEVVRELKANAGSQFDRKVVNATISVLAEEKKESQAVFNDIGIFANLNIGVKHDETDDPREIAKALSSLEKGQKLPEGAEAAEIDESLNIWGNIRLIDGDYIFVPINRTADFTRMRFEHLKLYVNMNERMYRYIPVIKKVGEDRMIFSDLKLVDDSNAFAIRWLLDGFFVSPSRSVYKVFVTMVGGDFVDFYIFTEELDEVLTQGIVRIMFEDEKNATLHGMIIYNERMGDKTHFRLKYAGLKESEKQMIFSQIFKKQIEIRALQAEAEE